MKKIYLLTFACLLLLALPTKAQLPNAQFENWRLIGSPPIFDWAEPLDWTSTNPVTEFGGGAGIMRSFDVHDGLASLRIMATSVGDRRSIICNGVAELDETNITIDIMTGGTPISNRAGGVRGYYQYRPDTLANDSAYVLMFLTHYNTNTGQRDIVAEGRLDFIPNTSYSTFDLVLDERMPGTMPDTVVVAFFYETNSIPATIPLGALMIDNLELTPYVPTSVHDISALQHQISVYPNPAQEQLSLDLSGLTNHVASGWHIQDLNGRSLYKSIINNHNTQIDISTLDPGYYVLAVKLANGLVLHHKFIKATY